MDEFEKWAKSPYGLGHYAPYDLENVWKGWNAAWEQQQAIIDKQAAEIAALRGFANKVVNSRFRDLYLGKSKKYGLIDENGNPTKLLTGESE